jgi:signal transduction histidine kinase/CheY-like chemotaxis protein
MQDAFMQSEAAKISWLGELCDPSLEQQFLCNSVRRVKDEARISIMATTLASLCFTPLDLLMVSPSVLPYFLLDRAVIALIALVAIWKISHQTDYRKVFLFSHIHQYAFFTLNALIFNHPILLRHGGILIPLMAIVLLVSLPGRFRSTALLCLYAPGVSIVFWGVLRPDPESWTDIAIIVQMTVLAYVTGAILRQRLNRMRREQFLHIQRERRINQTLLEAKEAAEQGSRVKAEFLAVMSHEIRTPMTGVLGMMRLVLDSPLSPQDRRRLQLAHQSGEGLLGILDDILDMSRLEAGAVTFAAAPFSLSETIQDVVALCALQAEAKGLTLDLALSDGTPDWGIGDAARLRQVLFNLVGNAVKFTEQGHIHITANAEQTPAGTPGVVLTVTDSGIGIAPEQREHIFGLFGQADASIQRRFGGTGLGLTICKRLVEGMGGQIDFISTPGHGSTFSVHLPFTSAEKPKAIKAPAPAHQQRRSLSLLVADDQEVNSEVAKAYLCAAGHQVTTVRNGAEALAQVQAQDFDLVLMDMRMPVMDGLEATRRIRALPGPEKNVLIFALTANALADDRDLCINVGMDGHITKPITPEALNRTLDHIIDQRPLSPLAEQASSWSSSWDLLLIGPAAIAIRPQLTALKHRAFPATSAEAGVQMIQARPFDRLLIDHSIPPEHIAALIQAAQTCRPQPTIMLLSSPDQAPLNHPFLLSWAPQVTPLAANPSPSEIQRALAPLADAPTPPALEHLFNAQDLQRLRLLFWQGLSEQADVLQQGDISASLLQQVAHRVKGSADNMQDHTLAAVAETVLQALCARSQPPVASLCQDLYCALRHAIPSPAAQGSVSDVS